MRGRRGERALTGSCLNNEWGGHIGKESFFPLEKNDQVFIRRKTKDNLSQTRLVVALEFPHPTINATPRTNSRTGFEENFQEVTERHREEQPICVDSKEDGYERSFPHSVHFPQ